MSYDHNEGSEESLDFSCSLPVVANKVHVVVQALWSAKQEAVTKGGGIDLNEATLDGLAAILDHVCTELIDINKALYGQPGKLKRVV